MADETIDFEITYTDEQVAEHEKRQKTAAERDEAMAKGKQPPVASAPEPRKPAAPPPAKKPPR